MYPLLWNNPKKTTLVCTNCTFKFFYFIFYIFFILYAMSISINTKII